MNCHEKKPGRKQPILVKVGNTTVKVYQIKNRGYTLFTVVHYESGQRKRENFGDLAEAKRKAGEIALRIEKGQREVLILSNTDRESYVAAMTALRPLGIPLHAAIEEYVAARAHLNGESILGAIKDHASKHRKVIEKRVGEVVAEMLEAKKRDGLSVRYLETLRSNLNRFAASFQIPMQSVTATLIDEWLARQNVGPRARNNMRLTIVTLFHFARARGYLPKGLPTEAEDVARAKHRDGKIEIFTPKEMARIMKAPNADHRLIFALGGFAGVRRAEIERLEWSDFNFERGHITVAAEKAKTATRRLVPIQPNLMQWLAPYRKRTGKLFASRRTVENAIAWAKEKKIKWPQNVLRHSYGSYRLAGTADAPRVSLEMGNSVAKLMTNYRELADEHDATAWFAIAPKKPKNVVSIAA